MEIKNARGRRALANIYEDFRGIDIEDYLERIVDQYDFPQLERDELTDDEFAKLRANMSRDTNYGIGNGC